jgi:hypothetical protein
MGILLILIGGLFEYLGYRLKYSSPKYHYEKTTTGRTIKFMDYDESERHKQYKVYGILMIFLGVLFFGIGLCVMLFISD